MIILGSIFFFLMKLYIYNFLIIGDMCHNLINANMTFDCFGQKIK